MNAQRGLDLFFNVLLARSRLGDGGGERRQSGRQKKPSPDGTEEETQSLMFCLVLNRLINVNCNNTLLIIDKYC